MKFQPCRLAGLVLIEPPHFADDRGFFTPFWNRRAFLEGGVEADFVQDNHSLSRPHVLRGLHYQIRQPQGKLIRVLRGEVFDVAVDLRRSSATFGQWEGVRLSAANRRMLWIPAGFAHGFLALGGECEFFYKCTDYYAPQWERCIVWNDGQIGIDWPLPPGVTPLVSAKDNAGLPLAEAEIFP